METLNKIIDLVAQIIGGIGMFVFVIFTWAVSIFFSIGVLIIEIWIFFWILGLIVGLFR